jgi:hypothetical protein
VAWDLHPIFGRCLPAGDPEALLFRYSSLEQGAAVALRKSLLLSPLWAMNDPNEAAFQQVHPITGSDHPDVSPRHIERDEWLPIRKDLNQRRRNTRIASFTQDAFEGGDTSAARADSRGYARQTMWSHYAELGQGICLVFDRSKLMDAAVATWGRGAFVGDEVRYYPGFNWEFAEMSMIDFDNLDFDRHYGTKVVRSMFSKNADWAVEREFRLLIPDTPTITSTLPIADAVVGMALGPKFPLFKMPTAIAVAEAFGILDNTAHAFLDSGVIMLAPWKPLGGGAFGLYDDEELWAGEWGNDVDD